MLGLVFGINLYIVFDKFFSVLFIRLRVLFRDISPLGYKGRVGIEADFILLFHIQPRAVCILKPISGKLPHGSVIIIGKM